MTIAFEAELCGKFQARKFSIYHMASGVSYQTLFKKDDNQDLEVLF